MRTTNNSFRTLIAAATAVFALSLAGAAYAGGSTPILQDTVGAGPNTSYFVLDFGTPSSPDAFAFAYDWSGTPTDGDLIDALASAGIGFSDTSTFYPAFDERLFDSFTYNGNTFSDITNPFGYWNFWTSPNGVAWTSPIDDADDTDLTNGSWEGWTWVPNYLTDNAEPPTTPFESGAATPEPGTWALFLTGAAAPLMRILRGRRRGAAAA